MVSGKISKTIGLLPILQNFLARAALITIYKAFIRPHNLCLKVYDGNLGDMLTKKLAALSITSLISFEAATSFVYFQ